MGKPWVKMWNEMRLDRKLRPIDPAWRWAWCGLLMVAADYADTGELRQADGTPITDEDMADEIALPLEMWRQAKAYFVQRGMLSEADGVVTVRKYQSRQAPNDKTAAERKRRQRRRDDRRDVTPDLPVTSPVTGDDGHTPDIQKTEDRRQKTEDRRQNPKLSTSSSSLEAGGASRHDDDDVDPVTMAPKDFTLEQFAAWNALQLTAPTFTDATEFVRKNDAWLIGYWCLAADANPEGVRNAAAFVRAGVEKGVKPRLRGDLTAEWMKQLDRAGDWVGRSEGDSKVKH